LVGGVRAVRGRSEQAGAPSRATAFPELSPSPNGANGERRARPCQTLTRLGGGQARARESHRLETAEMVRVASGAACCHRLETAETARVPPMPFVVTVSKR